MARQWGVTLMTEGVFPAMPQMPAVWTEAVDVAETFADMQREHRADGRVDAEEAERESRYVSDRLLPIIEHVGACMQLAQTVMRRGPDSPRARRLARDLEGVSV
jgi:hypothetical protein